MTQIIHRTNIKKLGSGWEATITLLLPASDVNGELIEEYQSHDRVVLGKRLDPCVGVLQQYQNGKSYRLIVLAHFFWREEAANRWAQVAKASAFAELQAAYSGNSEPRPRHHNETGVFDPSLSDEELVGAVLAFS